MKSLVLTSELRERGRTMQVKLHLALPDRYRHDVLTGDAHLVHATDGQVAWATLDDVAVPLEIEEVRRLEEQLTLVQLSLLVGLEGSDTVSVSEKGFRDGLEWLEADYRKSDAGPYLLGFDSPTGLLTRAEWKIRRPGQMRSLEVSLALRDYRRTEGVMVPFVAVFTASGEIIAENRVIDVSINRAIESGIFGMPPPAPEPPIRRRTTSDGHSAVLGPLKGRPDDAERILTAWIKENDLPRNGPMFTLLTEGRPVAVGIPIQVAKDRPLPPAVEGAPAIRPARAEEVLATIVTPVEDALLETALKALIKHAAKLGVEPSGPVRHVAWNKDITQLQLPIRARPK